MKPILALLLLLCGPQSDSFTTVVEKNFAAWDRDEDGKLSVEETDRLVLDPAIKGEPAVAIGVIKAVQRGGKWELPDLTVAYFKSCTDGEKTHPDFEKMYAAATRKLGKTSRELFGDGAPSIDSFHQGNIRDCYFLAPVGAAVARDAEAVRKMFAPLEDGGCEVRFPGGKSVRLAPLTDAELAMSSTAGDDGLWLPMLEKAFATVRNESRPAEKRKDVPTDLIARGGAAGPCIELLTGKRAKSLAVRRKSERDREPDDERIREVLPQLREAIKAAVKDRRLICCGTPKEVATPGIAGKHMYAVLGYDEEKDLVDVWNPWGNSFKPKGDSGLKNGYRTKGGRFSVPLDDFVRVFGGITFECE